MADIHTATWNEIAANNNAAPPDGMPEGQAAASVNDGVREVMGAIKRDWNRRNPTTTTTGTSSAFLLAYTMAPAGYVQGLTFCFIPHVTSAASATLNPGGGARPLLRADGTAVRGGELRQGLFATVVFDATFNGWRVVDATENTVTPEDFGAKNDGTTDDSAAIQAALTYVRSLPMGGRLLLKTPQTRPPGNWEPGGYRVTAESNGYTSQGGRPVFIEWEPGAAIINAIGHVDRACLRFTHPDVPRQGIIAFGAGNPSQYFNKSPIILINPRFIAPTEQWTARRGLDIEHRFMLDLHIVGRHEFSHYGQNTAIRLSAAGNCRFQSRGPVWGAGYAGTAAWWKSDVTTRISIAAHATAFTVQGGTAAMEALAVGKSFASEDDEGQFGQLFTIATLAGDGMSGTVTQAAERTHTNQRIGWEALRGSTAARSATVTLMDRTLTSGEQADLTGRSIVIPSARAGNWPANYAPSALRAMVQSCTATTITLDRVADRATSGETLMFSPAVEIIVERYTTNAGSGRMSNADFEWEGLELEWCVGLPLFVEDVVGGGLDYLKTHTTNPPDHGWNGALRGVMKALFSNNVNFVIQATGPCDGQVFSGRGMFLVQNPIAGNHFEHIQAQGMRGVPVLRVEGGSSQTQSRVTVGPISVYNALGDASLRQAVTGDGAAMIEHLGPITSGWGAITPGTPAKVVTVQDAAFSAGTALEWRGLDGTLLAQLWARRNSTPGSVQMIATVRNANGSYTDVTLANGT